MAHEGLRYDAMVEEALRGVVRSALQLAARDGLPGTHHFYITFRTRHAGVELPFSLLERYPREMTVVLQHRFWDLKVEADRFSVTLTFNEVPERLVIPFAAITAFADPSVRFGLQFATAAEEEPAAAPAQEGSAPAVPEAPQAAAPKATAGAADAAPAPAESKGKAEKIVPLDQFRRKS